MNKPFMNKRLRNLAVTLAGALAATGLSTVTATPAAAADTCPWPYVCFTDNSGRILTMYKDTGYQITGSKTRTATHIENSRNDDCAWIYFSSGDVVQLRPGGVWGLGNPVVAINITYGC
ncbi:hypothetical protein [Streptomyces sp. NPDC050504]|uniref:hypothetical protein n=1 Tax=Streptomyces sp. NPDC050504 TaxID=3365618 RepID=UPI0037B50FFE